MSWLHAAARIDAACRKQVTADGCRDNGCLRPSRSLIDAAEGLMKLDDSRPISYLWGHAVRI
jgi:hypothetical protein